MKKIKFILIAVSFLGAIGSAIGTKVNGNSTMPSQTGYNTHPQTFECISGNIVNCPPWTTCAITTGVQCTFVYQNQAYDAYSNCAPFGYLLKYN